MHCPVMLAESLEWLAPKPVGWWADLTVGGGGHTRALLDAVAPDGQVLGLDQDGEVLTHTAQTLAEYGERLRLVHANFRELPQTMQEHSIPELQGAIMDLGVSSYQLDDPQRGFSFRASGPLDMRMDSHGSKTAADLANHADEETLAKWFYEYGEERRSRRLARMVAQGRPWQSTLQLASAAEKCLGRQGRIHPATRMFQALRIVVNDELGALDEALPALQSALAPGGRLVVISFHSLEDRLVKQHFRSGGWERLNKHVLRPGLEELRVNPRARSARLRAAAKIERR